jgi:RES domain-containing protein
MLVWRLSTLEDRSRAFDGEGARLFPGRWNHEGVAVVYTSAHLSLAALELLVHLDQRHLQRPLFAFSVELPEESLETVTQARLPAGWAASAPSDATKTLGSEWAQGKRSLALAVPSAVVPQELNVLLNPAHPRFGELTMSGPQAFSFDPRLRRATS